VGHLLRCSRHPGQRDRAWVGSRRRWRACGLCTTTSTLCGEAPDVGNWNRHLVLVVSRTVLGARTPPHHCEWNGMELLTLSRVLNSHTSIVLFILRFGNWNQETDEEKWLGKKVNMRGSSWRIRWKQWSRSWASCSSPPSWCSPADSCSCCSSIGSLFVLGIIWIRAVSAAAAPLNPIPTDPNLSEEKQEQWRT